MKGYGKNYPLERVQSYESMKELWEQAASQSGDKIGVKYVSGGKIVGKTYASVFDDISALGTALWENAVADRHIAVIGKNSYAYLLVLMTGLSGPGVLVPVDKELPLADIINVLNDSDSEALFYAAKYEKWIDEIREACPKIKLFICTEEKGLPDAESALNAKDKCGFEELLAAGRYLMAKGDRRWIDRKPDIDKLRLIVYTSGTTGNSKGVMLSERNLVSVVYYGLQIENLKLESCLSVLPYHHCFEALGTVTAVHSRACICINENLKYVQKNLERFQPEYMFIVPAFAERFYKKIWETVRKQGKEKAFKRLLQISDGLMKLGIDKRRTLFKAIYEPFGGKLKKLVCGGAPLRPEIGDFFNSIGITLVNGYGISECSPLVSANRDHFNDPRTVGVPMPCVELSFDNPDEDGNGELCVKGPIVMLGYYKRPELTREVLSEDGWFHTGDYGRLNEKGQLLITGRKKNLIVLDNGKNVFPEELEGYIGRVDYITECVVSGLKNDIGQEVGLIAEVWLSDESLERLSGEGLPVAKKENGLFEHESREAIEARIKDDIYAVSTELPAHKQITKVLLRENEFPKTTTNKIKR